ncbi:flagellar hook-basal body complex protein FliE [Parvularcula lutaonensis]|uniref:Flagellar hook-basal body complex protein FliE n=1 Tax=Parvularcula lutaonensis TaxID=491923 RepID=A0ABV7MA28_9PROT|nr:flagellar hook-basal body complex protein FliE [Parvularcula lutaonensis]GGY43857.1 flagellar hook-basal body complex protein FliE [Parvularcula lutaonensis]
MNINEVAAASAYGSMAVQPGSGSELKALGERFAAVFDRADAAVEGFATKNIDAQSVVEALSQAELALQTAITVRDRVVAAYQEILRMPI